MKEKMLAIAPYIGLLVAVVWGILSIMVIGHILRQWELSGLSELGITGFCEKIP